MNFACIQDCSVCPFYGHDVSKRILNNIENSILPKGLSETVKEPIEDEVIAESIEEKNDNLPVIAEVQYSISDEKKKLFRRRKC